MQKYKILIEGYAHEGENGNYFASPTTTLIFDGNLKVLVDPGANKEMLLESLKRENLEIDAIDKVYLTHYHPDHFLNLKLFPNHDLIDGSMIWKSDEEITFEGNIAGTDIRILPTPGHSPEHTSLILNTEEGIVCVAQDVFWWEDGKQQTDNYEDLINLEDPFASDLLALKESRKKVLDVADWIIPGHGKKFKNNFKK